MKNIFDQKVVTFEISTRQVKQIEIAVTEPQETTIVIESSVACDDPILHYLTNGNVVCHPSAEDRQAAKPAVTPAVEEHLLLKSQAKHGSNIQPSHAVIIATTSVVTEISIA